LHDADWNREHHDDGDECGQRTVLRRAEQAADVLRGAGWNVSATDNWYGNIPADTVYYPPALHDAAVKLAKVLHIERLHTAVAPMRFDRLTVIMVSS